ncbi:MAG: hypothetical protein LBI67_07620 [Treponema sp.]|jgi:hypothetical protein|nr:hypothetical protein [Treponema sp.]
MKRAVVVSVILLFFAGVPLFSQWEGEDDLSFDFDRDWRRKPLIPNDNLIFGQPEFLDFDLGMEAGYNDGVWGGVGVRMDYRGGPLSIVADLVFKNDQKYAPTRVMIPAGNLAGLYFFMNEGGVSYDSRPFSLSAGRFRIYDEVDSPYSLFVNSLGHTAVTMKARYESKHWIYQSRWIELNSRNTVSSPAWNEYNRRKAGLSSPTDWSTPSSDYGPNPAKTDGLSDWGFPDRGVNYKVYALKVNDWRLGFLDAVVYTGRSFDLEYFLNPIPQFFINYAKDTPGRPWSTDSNENALTGFFWDVNKKDSWDAYAQILIDDFSVGFAKSLFSGFSDNPWKTAWSLGGRVHTSAGRFGFHHGGALKFTFEPIGTDENGRYAWDAAATAYGYTYYPETRYFDSENGGEQVNILIEDNMVGYKHGENNLAFQVDYQNTFQRFLVTAELELLLAGANSPANPWQQHYSRSGYYDSGKSGSQLLDGPFEKRLEFRVNVSRKIGPVALWGAFALGGRWDKLVLAEPDPDANHSTPQETVDNDIWIWKPSGGRELIFRISLGFKYTLGVL